MAITPYTINNTTWTEIADAAKTRIYMTIEGGFPGNVVIVEAANDAAADAAQAANQTISISQELSIPTNGVPIRAKCAIANTMTLKVITDG